MIAERVLIVGAGLAGSRCAQTLRAEGFQGEITLVGDERHRPYERPALSKQFLAGTQRARPPARVTSQYLASDDRLVAALLVNKPDAVSKLRRRLATQPLAA